MNNQNHHSPNPLMLLGLGVVVGWVAKKFLESPAAQDMRDDAIATAQDFRDLLFDSDEVAQLEDIFGETSDNVREAYDFAQKHLVRELAALRTTMDDVDKDKYRQIVTEIITQMKDEQAIPEKQLTKLRTALEEDFQKLQTNRKTQSRRKIAAKATH